MCVLWETAYLNVSRRIAYNEGKSAARMLVEKKRDIPTGIIFRELPYSDSIYSSLNKNLPIYSLGHGVPGTWCPGTWCQIFILDILIKYPFLNIFLLASDRALTLLKNGRQKFVKESSRPVSPSSPMKGRRLRLAARGYFVL
jgi:hypothetical protein